MDVEEALKLVEQLTLPKTGKKLNNLQTAILRGAWQDQTYRDLATTRSWSEGYLKQAGSKLWQLLSEVLGEPVNQNNFRAVLERHGRLPCGHAKRSQLGQIPPLVEPPGRRLDWGEAVDVSVFYGREPELEQLCQWIASDRCRLVTLLGMGGIGKTALSVRCVEQVQDEFEVVIWRSLRYAPPLKELLPELLQLLSHQPETDFPKTVESGISRLISYFRERRCLIVLDQFETILHPGKLAGQYLQEHEAYQELIRRVVVESHQSCLLIASRERNKDITVLANSTRPVRCLHLTGLGEAAREILKENALPEPHQWNNLINLYRGNPLALKIVSATLQDVFGGSISDFLSQSSLFLGDFSQILDQHFSRLTDLEKQVLYLLAIEGEPVTLSTLQENIGLGASNSEVIQALSSLSRRSLLEKTTTASLVHFTLQPLVMKYVSNELIDQLCEEILVAINTKVSVNARWEKINLLLKLTRADKSQQFSEKYQKFLRDVKQKLQRRFERRGEESIAAKLNALLSTLPQQSRPGEEREP